MIERTVEELTPIVGTRPACRAVGASVATIYRRRRLPEPRPPRPRPTPARALTARERESALAELHSERLAQAGAVARLLDLRRRQPRLALREQLAGEQQAQPAGIEAVGLRLALLPAQRLRLPGVDQMHLEPTAATSSRATQRQPVVASITTVETRPRQRTAQSASPSRPENRSSTNSPEPGSRTADCNTRLWMSIPAIITWGLPSSWKMSRDRIAARGGPLHDIRTNTGRQRGRDSRGT
jgi:hypothetical protein